MNFLKIMGRNLLDDELYEEINNSILSYRLINDNDIEVHIGYEKEKTNFKTAMENFSFLRDDFFSQLKGKYNIIAHIRYDNKTVKLIARKMGFQYLYDFRLECTDGATRIVSKFIIPKECQ